TRCTCSKGGSAMSLAETLSPIVDKKRARVTKAELRDRRQALYEICREFHPASVQQVFYQATVRGLIPKLEAGYQKIKADLVYMRRAGMLPYSWLVDYTGWLRRPATFDAVTGARHGLGDGVTFSISTFRTLAARMLVCLRLKFRCVAGAPPWRSSLNSSRRNSASGPPTATSTFMRGPPGVCHGYTACSASSGARGLFQIRFSNIFTVKMMSRFFDCVRKVMPPFSLESLVAEYAALLKTYRIGSVRGDRYAGEWPREQFRKYGIDYLPSDKSKSELYARCCRF